MLKPAAFWAILAATPALVAPPVFAADRAAPPISADHPVILAGGMSGGSGGMGGGGGGMGGGGHFGGDMFGAPMTDGSHSSQPSGEANTAGDSYTYQCITAVGRCAFVAPAWMRANSLKSGADCACSGGQMRGRVE
jgi:hypothetical protein